MFLCSHHESQGALEREEGEREGTGWEQLKERPFPPFPVLPGHATRVSLPKGCTRESTFPLPRDLSLVMRIS